MATEDTSTETTTTTDTTTTETTSKGLGWRKVIICALGMILVTVVSYSNATHSEKAIEYIGYIAGGFCGINMFKDALVNVKKS